MQKTQEELIEELRKVASAQNNGRGIQCVKSILMLIDRGDMNTAGTIRSLEGDKTRSYPEVERLLEQIFGCRLHLTHDCKDRWCQYKDY